VNKNLKALKNKRILYTVLNWGLGHACESVPQIRLLKTNNTVFLAAAGRAAVFLKSEFPALPFYNLPDHTVNYARNRILVIPKLIVHVPGLLLGLWREHRRVEQLVEELKIDAVISANRYGAYSIRVPSYFVTHQLRFKLPGIFSVFEIISEWFNRWYFRKYTRILILDEKGSENLSGDLSHSGRIIRHPKLHYIGIWTSIEKQAILEDIDILAIISGPEPQREFFAEKIIEQLRTIPGKRIVVLGKPEAGQAEYVVDGIEVSNFRSRSEINELLNRAKLVICRSGYASLAEFVALRKPALIIPTPGQTEQEYLASYLMKKGYFYSTKQSKLNLSDSIPIVWELCRIHDIDFTVNQERLFWNALEVDAND